jgi:hypothetical protein
MKKVLAAVLIVLMAVSFTYAADSKVSTLTELAAAPAESDELYINDGGTSKKITVINLLKALESALTSFAIHQDNLPSSLSGLTINLGSGSGVTFAQATATGTLSKGSISTTAPVFTTSVGAPTINLGTAGSVVGKVIMSNATSGSVEISPTTGALGTTVLTAPATSGTIAKLENKISDLAASTSSELAGKISDETGSGALVFGTGPTLTGVILGDGTTNEKIRLDPTPASDGNWNGITAPFTAGENVTVGQVCYFKAADSKMWLADADAVGTTKGMLAMATASISGNAAGEFLLRGFIRADAAFDYVAGDELYISGTAGVPTKTAPTASNSYVRIVGYAYSADIVYFSPDGAYVKVP